MVPLLKTKKANQNPIKYISAEIPQPIPQLNQVA